MIRRHFGTGTWTAAAAVLAVLGAGPAHAFPTKNITFIIPYSPGGGFDFYARAVGPFLEKYLPKKVNVVPRNLPGAGGRKGAAATYRAKPDGHTIGLFNIPGLGIPALLGKKVGYDLNKVTWLGRISMDRYVLIVAGKSGVTSLDGLRRLGRAVKITSTGYGSTGNAVINIARNILKLKSEVITGYKGSKAYILGTIRGDGDATFAPVTTVRKYVQSGDARPLVALEPNSPFPGVPTVASLGYPELSSIQIMRVIGGPPGIPKQVAKTLADALWKSMADPELIAITKKANRPLAPQTAAEARTTLEQQMEFYGKYKSWLGKRK